MTRILHRPRADEALIPCASAQPAPAAHLGRHKDRDRRIGFADVAAMPEPDWARTPAASQFWPGRFTVAKLVPAGQLATVPLTAAPAPTPRVLDDLDTVIADIRAAFAELPPYLRHEDWFAMALGSVAALAEPALDTSWSTHFEQLASDQSDSTAEYADYVEVPPSTSGSLTVNEQQRTVATHTYRVLGRVMRRVALDIPVWRWSVCDDAIDIRLGAMPNDHASLAAVMLLAEQFGLGYAETPHADGRDTVAADGRYDETPVHIWSVVAPCSCDDCGARKEAIAEQQAAQEQWFATEVLGLDGNRDFGEQLAARDTESEAM